MWELDPMIAKNPMELSCVGSEAVTLQGVWDRVCVFWVWNPEGGELKIAEPRYSCESQVQSFTLG